VGPAGDDENVMKFAFLHMTCVLHLKFLTRLQQNSLSLSLSVWAWGLSPIALLMFDIVCINCMSTSADVTLLYFAHGRLGLPLLLLEP